MFIFLLTGISLVLKILIIDVSHRNRNETNIILLSLIHNKRYISSLFIWYAPLFGNKDFATGAFIHTFMSIRRLVRRWSTQVYSIIQLCEGVLEICFHFFMITRVFHFQHHIMRMAMYFVFIISCYCVFT